MNLNGNLIVRLVIVGCLFASASAAPAQTATGTVYLYREIDTQNYGTQIMVYNSDAPVYLDGNELAAMEEHTWMGFKLPAGIHTLTMPQWRGTYTFMVTADHTYYLQVTQMVYPYLTQFISGASAALGLEKIRRSYRLKEKKVKLKSIELVRENPASKKKAAQPKAD
jgi:hypothetical protein